MATNPEHYSRAYSQHLATDQRTSSDHGATVLRHPKAEQVDKFAGLRYKVETEYAEIADIMAENPWSYALVDKLSVMPKDLESSLRGGVIVSRVVSDWNGQYPEDAFTPDESKAVVLGYVFTDIGRADEDKEEMNRIYASGRLWRNNPDAPEWAYVQQHPGRSRDLVLEAIGAENADSLVAQIPAHHHNRKLRNPYAAPGSVGFDELDPVTQRAVEIAAAVDVIEAITKNAKGEGRSYVDDNEFADVTWEEAVLSEVNVDPRIADIAVKHTLQYKDIAPKQIKRGVITEEPQVGMSSAMTIKAQEATADGDIFQGRQKGKVK